MRGTAALVATLAVVVSVQAAHGAGKGNTWSCSVHVRDAAGDIVRSDGAGDYVNGQAGVSCQIDKFNNWLYLTFASSGRRAARSLVVVGQASTDGAYNTITSGTELDIKFLSQAVAPYDVLPWRLRVSNSQFLGGFGQFTGDSSYNAGAAVAGTSSLAVTTIDACTWQATSYTTGFSLQTLSHGENATTQLDPRVALLTEAGIPGVTQAVVRGNFSMPFSATIRVIAGKTGCPQ